MASNRFRNDLTRKRGRDILLAKHSLDTGESFLPLDPNGEEKSLCSFVKGIKQKSIIWFIVIFLFKKILIQLTQQLNTWVLESTTWRFLEHWKDLVWCFKIGWAMLQRFVFKQNGRGIIWLGTWARVYRSSLHLFLRWWSRDYGMGQNFWWAGHFMYFVCSNLQLEWGKHKSMGWTKFKKMMSCFKWYLDQI